MTGASRRRRLRFSLRTLLFAVLLLGSAVSLWLNWQPWYRLSKVSNGEWIGFAAFSEDCNRVIWLTSGGVIHINDARTGIEIKSCHIPVADVHAFGVYAGHAICATAGHTDTVAPEEPWRIDFRSRHSKPFTYTFSNLSLDQAIDVLMTNALKEKFIYNQEVLDSGRTQRSISLKVNEAGALETLDQVLHQAELEAEFVDGAIHLVRKETFGLHRAEKLDHAVHVWELETGQEIATLSGQTSPIVTIAISPDGTHVLGASDNATARIWEAGGLQCAVLHTENHPLSIAAVSNNGKRVAGAINIPKIGAWNTENDSNIFVSTDLGSISSVAVSSDGRYAAFQYERKSVELWDLNAGTRVESMRKQFIGDSTEMEPVFSLRGDRLIAVRGKESKLALLNNDKELALDGRTTAANFSFDNERIVATYWFGSMIIDGNSGKTLAELPKEPRRLADLFDFSAPFPRPMNPFGESFPATPRFSPDRGRVIAEDFRRCLGVWAFCRPEAWWGVACLVEFWLTVVFACAFVWSLLRDRREV